MKIYGQELMFLGIVIIIAVLVISAAFFTVYYIGSSKLKKQLEREYGKKEQ